MHHDLESRLLKLASVFLIVFSIILTLSPAVRERSWSVDYRWSHWVGIAAWLVVFPYSHREYKRLLPDHDQYLLPLSALLTGWGLLSVWRLLPEFGLRQTVWMLAVIGLFTLIPRLSLSLAIVRRYKYLLLTLGLFLTALTLFFGSNPAGSGPRLWLGCCGIYFQPSEPLKLLFVVYLAAYLADRLPVGNRLIPLLFPTLFVTGLALTLLFVQRDLGTASIFILIYAIVVFIATGYHRVLLASASTLAMAGISGYFLIDLIHSRINSWINPWGDPSGRSYQIVQSLLSIANGGVSGRGPGLGSPSLVPIAHSDFIFTAITEETGLVGVISLLTIIGLLIARSLRIAMLAPDRFQRLLATGISAYLSVQSLLIIGGNLRILPLTGVTLPFVSYGGSSLLTSFIALFALLLISNQLEEEPAPLPVPQPYFFFSALVGIGLAIMAVGVGWWSIVRGPDLLTRTDNARRSISDRYVQRGSLVDRNNQPINITKGQIGELERLYLYPSLSPVVGYTHPVYGQAGLEASLDNYLRGLQGNPTSLVWWHRILYGTPPPGLDVRISIDLSLQTKADRLLERYTGALLLLNAETGEILAMTSYPSFDPNRLDELGPSLVLDENAPLINRVTLGHYPPGNTPRPLLEAQLGKDYTTSDTERIQQAYTSIGFYNTPALRMPVAQASQPEEELRVSPLQMGLAIAALSAEGVRPPPRVAIAVNTTQQGWVVLPALEQKTNTFSPISAREITQELASDKLPIWEYTSIVPGEKPVTWELAGTLPDWKGAPLALVILLEESNSDMARQIAHEFLKISLSP